MKQLAAGIPFIPPLGRFHLMEKVSFLSCRYELFNIFYGGSNNGIIFHKAYDSYCMRIHFD